MKKVTIEITLIAETAQRFREVAKRVAVMDGCDPDAILAATVPERIADDYEQTATGDSGADYAEDMQSAAGKLRRLVENDEEPQAKVE